MSNVFDLACLSCNEKLHLSISYRMRKLVIIIIVFNVLRMHVYSKEINFEMKRLNLQTFLATCLKQVQNNAIHNGSSNDFNFRFLDDSNGKDFYINFTLSSNKTDNRPNRHLLSADVYIFIVNNI